MDEDRLEDETLQMASKISRLDSDVIGLAKKVISYSTFLQVIYSDDCNN